MATVAELTTVPLSGHTYIDALLDKGPNWNFLTGVTPNTLYYTFSITAGTEAGKTGQEAFTLAQQNSVRTAMDDLNKLTGIQFVETADGNAAQIHLCNYNIAAANTVGLCSWTGGYSYNQVTNVVTQYDADAYVYLDNVEWRARNRDRTDSDWRYDGLFETVGNRGSVG